ncbi:hypothetical protein KJ640_01110 [bacterium]|nr:hypothetical protein [bacterium]
MIKWVFFLALLIPFLGDCAKYSLLFPLGMEEGSQDLITAHSLVNRGFDSIPILKEQGFLRIIKGLLLDIPISLWTTTLQHEYFGHGARARELEVSVSYRLYLPWEYWPFGNKRAYTYYNTGYPEDIEQRLFLIVGGIESNNVLAHILANRIYRGDAHYGEHLFFCINKLYINGYIGSTPDPNSCPEGFKKEAEAGGDIANYLIQMEVMKNRGYPEIPNQSIKESYAKLRRESLWNILDPLVALSIYGIGKYWLFGEEMTPISLKFIPSTRFNLTPIGSEAYLDLYTQKGQIYLRYGEGQKGDFYGGGIGIDKMPIKEDLSVGCNIDWWHQPITGDGYNLEIGLTKDIADWLGFSAKTGFKGKGYLMGKSFLKGGYGAIGIDLIF